MENKTRTQPADSDMVQIKAINEDAHWLKEYGFSKDSLQNEEYDMGIYDLIIESHIKTQKSGY